MGKIEGFSFVHSVTIYLPGSELGKEGENSCPEWGRTAGSGPRWPCAEGEKVTEGAARLPVWALGRCLELGLEGGGRVRQEEGPQAEREECEWEAAVPLLGNTGHGVEMRLEK